MRKICRFLLKALGWTADGGPVPEDKAIILGVPHTSAMDFLISYLYYTSVGGRAGILIKKEFFWGPLGPILKALGGVPVDRKHGATVVHQCVNAVRNSQKIHLAIAPEGTRKATVRWKTGFYTIAKACDIPVYLGYFDWGSKHVGCGVKFELSDDPQADLEKIRRHYAAMKMKGRHPEGYLTGFEEQQS